MSDLFTWAELGTPEKPATKLEAAFWEFHRANPQVYELFKAFTQRVLARGYKNHSARDIIHRIRWETDVETHGEPAFKINDHRSAYYGRLWMRDHPEHPDFFRTRKTKGVSGALACEADA